MIFKKAQSDDAFDNEIDPKNKAKHRAGDMAHWFGVLTSLVQDAALMPRTYVVVLKLFLMPVPGVIRHPLLTSAYAYIYIHTQCIYIHARKTLIDITGNYIFAK